MNQTLNLTALSMMLFLLVEIILPVAGNCQTTEPVRFAIIGDRTGGHTSGVYGDILTEIRRLKPEFIVTVGDVIEGYTEDSVKLFNEWEEYQRLIADLEVPIHHTPGNHDITNDFMESFFQQRFGSPYRSFNFKNIHLVILDNSRWEKSEDLPEEQITWLQQDLTDHQDAAQTLVFMHKPFWFSELSEGKPDRLHSIFVAHGVEAVITGHFHHYFSAEFDGIQYTSVGSSGGSTTWDPTQLMPYHYTWVTVNETGIHLAPIRKGSVQPWDYITRSNLTTVFELKEKALSFNRDLRVADPVNIVSEVVEIEVYNPSQEFLQSGVVEWKIADNWLIEPSRQQVTLEPLARQTFSFEITCLGNLFPTPAIEMPFTFKQGLQCPVNKALIVKRVAHCRPANKPPKLDGEINEVIWQQPVTQFFDAKGNQTLVDQTEFYFAFDKKNLYLAAKCQEAHMDSFFASAKERDGAVYNDDCVGFFIHPGSDAKALFQIYLNPKGVIYDVEFPFNEEGQISARNTDWNAKIKVASYHAEDFWSVELKIPFKQFGIKDQPNGEWNLNLRRKQQHKKAVADWQIPIGYDPASYGVLVFK